MCLVADGRFLICLVLLVTCRHVSALSIERPVNLDHPLGGKTQTFLRDAVSFLKSRAFDSTTSVMDTSDEVSAQASSSYMPPHVNWDAILANEAAPVTEPQASEAYALYYGALHDVVGEDGVLMIHLEPQTGATKLALRNNHRANVTSKALAEAGIIPTSFPATDAQAAAAEDLKLGCLQAGHVDTHQHCSGSVREPDASKHIQMGQGCASTVEQAIADSHRRALIAAQERDHEWTAIIEDDVTPSISSEWGEAFAKAWAHIPLTAKFVRLGWCTFAEDVGPINQHVSYDDGTFRIIDWMSLQNNWYYTGGCTTGYVVHKSIIPDLLSIFPCCSPIDTCLEQEFFYSPPFCRQDMSCLGRDIMVSLDAIGSTNYAAGRTMLKQQAGVMIQDNSRMKSSRPKFNQTS